MSFAALSPSAAFASIAAVALSIWLLYLIKPRKPRVVTASTLLWRRVLGTMRTRSERWRWFVSLLLALTIGLSLALALTRPQLGATSSARIVVIVDNSASMGARTRDGRTRWQNALDGARQVVRDAGAGSEILVLDTTGRARIAGFVPQSHALDQLNSITLSPDASGRLPPLPAGDTIARAYLFTDGVGVGAVPKAITLRSVFEAADNVGITAFTARPMLSDPTRYEAFLQVVNTAASAKPVSLEIVGAAGFRVDRTWQLGAAATANVTLDVSAFEQGPLRARVTSPGDAFGLDDTAFCVVPPHRMRRVLLVTRGNEVLEDSLRALPGVALSISAPPNSATLPAADAYVFDAYVPAAAPAAGALLFQPPAVTWLNAKWVPASRPAIARWDDSHPLSPGVAWRDLRLEAARVATPEAGAAAVVSAEPARAGAPADALIVAGRARARWVAVGFALQNSNFPLQPGFPVFLGNALSWLTEGPRIATESLGRIEVPIANARVVEGGERRIAATATAHGTLFEAARPGVYVATNGEEQLVVVANATDPRIAQINRQQTPAESSDAEAQIPLRLAWPEPWIWLLGLAFIALGVEWAAFSRRLTR